MFVTFLKTLISDYLTLPRLCGVANCATNRLFIAQNSLFADKWLDFCFRMLYK